LEENVLYKTEYREVVKLLNEELKARIQTLRNTMKEQLLDAYLVVSEHDIWYYTNITYKPEERPFFLIIDLVSDIPQLLVPKLEESHVKKGILPFQVISYWDYPATDTTTWHSLLNETISKYSSVGIESTIPLHL
jgi:Xaa-Pro dipeptidase